jgi:glutamate-1-semialdehyde 2,1-aminomutase
MTGDGSGQQAAGPTAAALRAAMADYAARNPESHAQFDAACRSMPGGNTRTVLYYAPFPLCMVRGEGCRLWDADGHGYVDLLGEFTAGLYGHSDPAIRAAVDRALDGGLNLSGHNALAPQLAAVICARFPSIDRVRFTNSGTEANLMALAAATAVTGRRRILVFEGGYHGSVLSFPPGGSPLNVPHDVVVAPYNDVAAARAAIEAAGDDLAAILVEPMQGAGGCIPGDPDFLAMLRDAARASGAVLIFDEVMTSRLSAGGRQALLGITPDLTTLGKYIGGGLTFGAFGGREAIMAQFDPRRPGHLDHPGTFNNNVVSMAAGLAGMTERATPAALETLNRRGETLRERLNAAFEKRGAPYHFTGLGSVMNVHVRGDSGQAETLKGLFFFDMLARGFYCARRGLVALSLPFGDAEADRFVAAVEDMLAARADLLGVSAPA